MQTHAAPATGSNHATRLLLRLGLAAGPLYVIVGLVQILAREGFDMRRHPLSLLSNGELGWIQTANFVLSGILVVLGTVGVRRLLHPSRAGTWGPLLLGVWGLGLLGAGAFPADPAPDFPPGAAVVAEGISRTGLLHFVFGAIGFYAVIAACLVFARRFAAARQPVWTGASVLAGAALFSAFAALPAGFTGPAAMLALYGAVLGVWIWHTALYASLLGQLPADR
jgi:hypothetical protein